MDFAAWSPRMLSVLRIVTALIFLEHGTAKLLGFPHQDRMPAPWTISWVGGWIELVGGVMLVLGLFSRPVAFLLSGEMAVAYWYSHFPRNPFPLLSGGDAAILYCFVFLTLFVTGPGPWSLDASRGRA